MSFSKSKRTGIVAVDVEIGSRSTTGSALNVIQSKAGRNETAPEGSFSGSLMAHAGPEGSNGKQG